MLKRIIALITITAVVFSFAGCKEKKDKQSHIVDNQPNVSTVAENTNTTDSAPEAADDAPQTTLAPAQTLAPDSAQKAGAKISDGGSANAIVSDNGVQREVDLEFQLTNSTGIDFHAMLIEPVTADLRHATNRFPEGFVFKNGSTINLAPPSSGEGDGYVLDTTLFTIAAIDEKGTGYVFQNIDLASSKLITLEIENGVPKATIN